MRAFDGTHAEAAPDDGITELEGNSSMYTEKALEEQEHENWIEENLEGDSSMYTQAALENQFGDEIEKFDNCPKSGELDDFGSRPASPVYKDGYNF